MNIEKILNDHHIYLKNNRLKGKRADFSYTNLQASNFVSHNFTYAKFKGANLTFANMDSCDLTRANLIDANLTSAKLMGALMRGADLTGANLTGADIRWVIGNGKEIKTVIIGIFTIVFTKEVLAIGCEQHPLKDWREGTVQLEGEDLELWEKYGDKVLNIVDLGLSLPSN